MTICRTEKVLNNAQIMDSVIELKGIRKKYAFIKPKDATKDIGCQELWALKDVSFEVGRGQILGIIGRNGAGKTTLLNIIAGVLSPTQGEICLKGRALGLFNLGVGFQDELTGKENIFLNGAIIQATKKELDKKLSAIVDFSELGDFINMPLGTYSQGMRLRLGFSIIINLDCDILIIDEVLAVGDVLFQSKCFKRLMDFKRQGKTLIISSQNMDLIERLCDKVVLLDHGKMLFSGDVADGINKYRELLSREKFFVGPVKEESVLVKDTKKWSDDIDGWGKKLGAKEIEIESVEFINKLGMRSNKIKTNESLKIKVSFIAKENIKDVHFGVAIFREDGVYCYGPNTKFDGLEVPVIKPGRGYFTLSYKELMLAPGEYKASVAIWDKNEALAFDYHNGYYKLIVEGGDNKARELLKVPYRIKSSDWRQRLILGYRKNSCLIDLCSIQDKWGQKSDINGIEVESFKLLGSQRLKKNTFMTNEPVFLNIKFSELNVTDKNLYLWLGIFRDDAVYCQGISFLLMNDKEITLSFPKLPLLPGGYNISIGIWDSDQKIFLALHHGIYPFRMVFTRKDHGTVYLEHTWHWRLNG